MASPAFVQREPQIIIPGEPGAAVYINGVDASLEVVEGEFGLDRPGRDLPSAYRGGAGSEPARIPALDRQTPRLWALRGHPATKPTGP
jgi:hypothetical protein